MDSVRFGRVLGIGTRLAAKTVAAAVDAAAAPNPNSAPQNSAIGGQNPAIAVQSAATEVQHSIGAPAQPPVIETPPTPSVQAKGQAKVQKQVQQVAARARKTSSGIQQGGKRFGEAVWGPFVRLSGVLWLEFTGVFFGVFALTAGVGALKLRAAMHGAAATGDLRMRFFVTVGMAVLFAYFCISSFVRAARRERRR